MTEIVTLSSILEKVKEADRSGKKIINLAIGEPDFKVPEYIKKALVANFANVDDIDSYTETSGIEPLRAEISSRFNKDTGTNYYNAENVIITPGGKPALYASLYATVKKGDSVIIFNPAWGTFATQVKLIGANPLFIDILNKRITIGLLESAIGESHPAAMIVNSPANPTGRVLTIDEILAIVYISAKYGIIIIADDVYREISYIPLPPRIAHFAPEKTITIESFSKAYAMTGWRLGYAIAPKTIVDKIKEWQSQVLTCASSVVQYAGLEAIKSHESIKEMIGEFANRRNFVAERLREIQGISFILPDGAFYFFIDISSYFTEEIKTSSDLSKYLFEKASVAIAPGSSFGAEGYIRLSFAASREDLEEGISQIKKALESLKLNK